MSSTPLLPRPVFWSVLFDALLLIASVIVPTIGSVLQRVRRTADGSNLRQIG